MMTPDLEASRPLRLLVVDDSRLILRMVRDFFTQRGYDVVEAENGEAAIARLSGFVPDVIVSDILMPEMDGWRLFEQVRRLPETSEVPFVFLTVESELPKRLRGFRLGADDYIIKPFAVEELHARIERILERRRALEEARRGGDALLAGSVEHLAISQYFRHVFISSELGADKPDPLFYQRALEVSGLAPGEVLHAGDDPKRDWAAASAAGLEVFCLQRPQNSLHDLLRLLL